jgi:hypothetical protein
VPKAVTQTEVSLPESAEQKDEDFGGGFSPPKQQQSISTPSHSCAPSHSSFSISDREIKREAESEIDLSEVR